MLTVLSRKSIKCQEYTVILNATFQHDQVFIRRTVKAYGTHSKK